LQSYINFFFYKEDQPNPEGGEPNPDDPASQPPKPIDSDEEEEIKVPPKNFTELDRLAFIVRALETECQIVPIGAYKLTPTHELRPNNAFVGLSRKEGLALEGYQHFRNPVSEEKKEYISRGDVLFKFDFFDSLLNDLPKGCWSIQHDASKTVVKTLKKSKKKKNKFAFMACFF
jgi:radial spoke head protein 9